MIFRSPHRFSNGFKSRLWLGPSRMFGDLFQSQSIMLNVWFRILCCCKVNLCPIRWRFLQGSVCRWLRLYDGANIVPQCVVTPGNSQAVSSAWFLPVERLGFQTRGFNFCLIRSEKALFGKLQEGCHMPIYSME